MGVTIGCIVEGHGDREAVPILLRRIAERLGRTSPPRIPPPIRIPKSTLLKAGELERAVELAARKTGGHGAVFVLIDSDDACPAELGPRLLERAVAARHDVPIAVVLAKPEFEAWFLAAAESLRGRRGLAANLTEPSDAEAVRGAKEWLSAQMEGGRKYVETLDQPALATDFDLNKARRADSFDKCYREVSRLLEELGESQ